MNKSILSNKVKFESTEWNNVSKEAKNLICKLLDKNPSKRILLENAFNHKFLKLKYRFSQRLSRSGLSSFEKSNTIYSPEIVREFCQNRPRAFSFQTTSSSIELNVV